MNINPNKTANQNQIEIALFDYEHSAVINTLTFDEYLLTVWIPENAVQFRKEFEQIKIGGIIC